MNQQHAYHFSHEQQQQQQQQQKKRDHRPFDSDTQPIGLPRKKFVSEESFANKLAAMSLDTEFYPSTSQESPQHRYNLRSNSIVEDDGTVKHATAFDEQEEEEEDYQQQQNMMPIDTGDKLLFDVDRNGLPMELKPGDNKFRVPDFVLNNSELTDPRDLQAIHNIMNPSKPNKHTHIEVLNHPSTHFAPTSMDID